MDCNHARPLLDAFVDGELDLVNHLEVERHVAGCPVCAPVVENLRACRAVLRAALPRYAAPAGLEQRIQKALQLPAAAKPRPKPVRVWSGFHPGNIAALAASFAVLLAIGYQWGASRGRSEHLVDEAVNDHVRSLMAGHLMDVASTDQHTVKPWFAGRLDFSPPVNDLATAGFPLIGGRLKQIDHRPAAALVYGRRQHTINVFVWPQNGTAVRDLHAAQNGYNVRSWTHGDLNFIAVSEIPDTDLAQFVAAFQAAH